MIDLAKLRQTDVRILALGNHPAILQSILDFDYLAQKEQPSLVGIVSAGRRNQKLFWGKREILIPCFETCKEARLLHLGRVGPRAQHFRGDPGGRTSDENQLLLLNLKSGRRTLESTIEFFEAFPDALGGHLFAEDVPETHALELYERYHAKKFLIGPSGVGLLLPNQLKLGAIGGVDHRQLIDSRLFTPGNLPRQQAGVAVLSASGGMTNELIRMLATAGKRLSFALTLGGDRFPITSPQEAFLAAEADPNTEAIVYYGELGGQDEYQLAQLIHDRKVSKPIVAYIAGIIGESFPTPVQFGHAKALARQADETASAKRAALRAAGVKVADSFSHFLTLTKSLPNSAIKDPALKEGVFMDRRSTLISSTLGREGQAGYELAGRSLVDWANPKYGLTEEIVSLLLGRPAKSKALVELTYLIFKLTIDHGPNVAGALNTIVTARAGKDLVSSLAAGLLTIGPRFGGAVNEAARTWLRGVRDEVEPKELVAEFNRRGEPILGIGHKKYRLGLSDPRVELLLKFARRGHPAGISSEVAGRTPPRWRRRGEGGRYLAYAQAVEKLTTAKKGNLILNVDGTIAALLLDSLEQHEQLQIRDLEQLVEAEFFNAFFVIPRTVGLIAHYLDQRRLDEGLLRLPDDLVLEVQPD